VTNLFNWYDYSQENGDTEDTKGKGKKPSPNAVAFQSLRERITRLLLSQAGLLTKQLCNYSYPSYIKRANILKRKLFTHTVQVYVSYVFHNKELLQ